MNKYRPHVLVLPEDDANRQIANGFLLAPALRSLGSYEKIGRALGDECAAAEANVWAHDLLAHNAGEAARLMARVRAVLF